MSPELVEAALRVRAALEDRYAERVRELEEEGLTTSDAQAVADAESIK